jgi:predicted ABC-type ATPase
MKRAYIFAGANASGKSTFISFLLSERIIKGQYINPDIILKEELKLSEELENYIKAFNIAQKRRYSAIEKGEDIILETTFATDEKVNFVYELKNRGYYVTFFFTGTESAKINAVYLVNRVQEGGHDVPIKKLISRRKRGFENVKKIEKIVDCLVFIDNSFIGSPPSILMALHKGQLCYIGEKIDSIRWIRDFYSRYKRDILVDIDNETYEFCQKITTSLKNFSVILEKDYVEKNKILLNANAKN